MNCAACTFSRIEGHWGKTIPPGYTHCRDCHATWPGGNKWGHCSRCHHTFAGITTFDRHHMAGLCDALVSVPTPTKETLPTWEGAHIWPGGGKRYIELVETSWGIGWQWNDPR